MSVGTISTSTFHTLALVFEGNRISLVYNGSTLAQVNDSTAGHLLGGIDHGDHLGRKLGDLHDRDDQGGQLCGVCGCGGDVFGDVRAVGRTDTATPTMTRAAPIITRRVMGSSMKTLPTITATTGTA